MLARFVTVTSKWIIFRLWFCIHLAQCTLFTGIKQSIRWHYIFFLSLKNSYNKQSMIWHFKSHVCGNEIFMRYTINNQLCNIISHTAAYKIAVARVTVWRTATPPNFICMSMCIITDAYTRCARFTTSTLALQARLRHSTLRWHSLRSFHHVKARASRFSEEKQTYRQTD